MPAGHTDLLDGIYGKWREGLRTFVQFGSGKKRIYPGRSRGETLSEVRAKSRVGNGTPALLTSSS
jgi:hypothetical protein